MPQETLADKKQAKIVLDKAFDCFIQEDVPFYTPGCELKYSFDKDLASVRDLGYYNSECITGTPDYYYPQDQQLIIQKKLNKKLEKFERKRLGKDFVEYFEYRDLQNYCDRRFFNSEEKLNCLVLTQ